MSVVSLAKHRIGKDNFFVDNNNTYYFDRPLGLQYMSLFKCDDRIDFEIVPEIPEDSKILRRVPKLIERLRAIPNQFVPTLIVTRDDSNLAFDFFTRPEVIKGRLWAYHSTCILDIGSFEYYFEEDFETDKELLGDDIEISDCTRGPIADVLGMLITDFFYTRGVLEFSYYHGLRDIEVALKNRYGLSQLLDQMRESSLDSRAFSQFI